MIWMLDTDTVGCLVNRAPGSDHVKRRISGQSPGEIRISAITVAEIHYGLAVGDVGEERRGALGPYDLLIAAHARHIRATLVTNNEGEFRRVPGLAVQNWLRPS